jgi:uncharacterized protein YbbK (DUF523 family)
MAQWAKRRVIELDGENLCGYIFKGGSPNSGMERVKVYDQNGVPAKIGVGMFARAFMENFPLLPNAKVTKTDIECSNGVIHVIDTVVLPK